MMKYTYHQGRTGPREWTVIETDAEGNERAIARCDNADDAIIIRKLYSGLESGEISLLSDSKEASALLQASAAERPDRYHDDEPTKRRYYETN